MYLSRTQADSDALQGMNVSPGQTKRGMHNHVQDTEAHQGNNRDFGVAIELHVPKQRYRPVADVNFLSFIVHRREMYAYRKAVTQSVRMLTAVHA